MIDNNVYYSFKSYSLTECSNRTYGLKCENTCGNCSNGDQCNHVNGICPNGCDAGVYSDKCDKGKKDILD